MSYGRTMRVLRRRGQWMSVGKFLAEQRRKHEPPPERFQDDSTVSDFLRGPAVKGRTPPAPSLEDYDHAPTTPYPDGES